MNECRFLLLIFFGISLVQIFVTSIPQSKPDGTNKAKARNNKIIHFADDFVSIANKTKEVNISDGLFSGGLGKLMERTLVPNVCFNFLSTYGKERCFIDGSLHLESDF